MLVVDAMVLIIVAAVAQLRLYDVLSRKAFTSVLSRILDEFCAEVKFSDYGSQSTDTKLYSVASSNSPVCNRFAT